MANAMLRLINLDRGNNNAKLGFKDLLTKLKNSSNLLLIKLKIL